MADMGLLVVAAESAHPGWGIAGNALGALIGGLFAALIAWRVAVHETEKQKAAAENARKDELRRAVMSSFVEACGRLQAALQEGDVDAMVRDFVWLGGRHVQVRILLHSQGLEDALRWFDKQWGRTSSAVTRALPSPQGRMLGFVPSRKSLREAVDRLTVLEYVCARWAVQTVDEWSTEEPPAWLILSEKKPEPSGSEDAGDDS